MQEKNRDTTATVNVVFTIYMSSEGCWYIIGVASSLLKFNILGNPWILVLVKQTKNNAYYQLDFRPTGNPDKPFPSLARQSKIAANPRWPPIQDGCQSKMAANPRWPPIQYGHQTKKVVNPRWPLIHPRWPPNQDGRQSKMAANPRWQPIWNQFKSDINSNLK